MWASRELMAVAVAAEEEEVEAEGEWVAVGERTVRMSIVAEVDGVYATAGRAGDDGAAAAAADDDGVR